MSIDKAIAVLKEHNENNVCPKSEIHQAIESAITVMTFFNEVMTNFGKKGGNQ
jgi:hypothetical protein